MFCQQNYIEEQSHWKIDLLSLKKDDLADLPPVYI